MPDVTDVLPLNRIIQISTYADKDLAELSILVWLVQGKITVLLIQPYRGLNGMANGAENSRGTSRWRTS